MYNSYLLQIRSNRLHGMHCMALQGKCLFVVSHCLQNVFLVFISSRIGLYGYVLLGTFRRKLESARRFRALFSEIRRLVTAAQAADGKVCHCEIEAKLTVKVYRSNLHKGSTQRS